MQEPSFRATIRPSRSTRERRATAGSVPRCVNSHRDCSSPISTSTRFPGSLDRLPLWSARRPAPVRFRLRDFFDGTDGPLGAAVPRPRAGTARPPADGACPSPRAATHVRLAVQPTRRLLLLDPRRSGARRDRARGDQHAVGRAPLVRVRRAAQHDHHDNRQGVARLAVPAHGCRLPDHVDGPRRRAELAHRGRARSHAGLRRRARVAPKDRSIAGARSPCWRATRCCRYEYRQGSMRKPRASSRAGFPCTDIPPDGGKGPADEFDCAGTRASRSSRRDATPLPAHRRHRSPRRPFGTRASATTPPRRLRLLLT